MRYEIVYVIDGKRWAEYRDTLEAAQWVECVVHGHGGHVLFVRTEAVSDA